MLTRMKIIKLYKYEIRSFLRMVAGGQVPWTDAQVEAKRLLEKAYGQDKHRTKSIR